MMLQTEVKKADLSPRQLKSRRTRALLGLQAKLWWRSLSSNAASMVMDSLFLLYGAGIMIASLFGALEIVSNTDQPQAVGALCALGTLAYLFIGLIMASAEGRMLPEQYCFLPLLVKDIRVPALVSSFFQVRALIALMVTLSTTIGGVVGLVRTGKAAWILPFALAMALTLLFTMLLGEVFALFSTTFATRSSKERKGVMSVLIFMVVMLGFGSFSFIGQRIDESGGDMSGLLRILNIAIAVGSWSLGALVSGVVNLSQAMPIAGACQLLVGVAILALTVYYWNRLLGRSLTEPMRSVGGEQKTHKRNIGKTPVLLPGLKWGAGAMIFSRAFRYFVRDSRLQMSLIVYPLLAAYLIVIPSNGAEVFFLLLFAVTPALLGSNDYGYDGPSNWLHFSGPVSIKKLVVFRHLASIAPALIVSTVCIGLCLAFMDARQTLAQFLGLVLGVAIGSSGVAILLSAFNPYPMAVPGTNPWRDKSGFSGSAFITSMAAMFGSLVPVLPGAVVFLIGFFKDNATLKAVGGVVAIAVPALAYLLLLRASIKRVESRYPEIFEKVRNFV